jgi:hypothetical protein
VLPGLSLEAPARVSEHFKIPSHDDAYKAVMTLTHGRGVDYAFEVISTAKTIELAFRMILRERKVCVERGGAALTAANGFALGAGSI